MASTVTILVMGAVFVLLERRIPYDDRGRLLRRGFWTDLIWYTLIQNWILGYAIAAIIAALNAHVSDSVRIAHRWPWLVQACFFLLLHDFYIYWFHRWQHANRLLWRIHEAHHSAADVDWLSGTRSHPLEILINQTVEFAPLAILGASPGMWFFKVAIDAVWGMYIHSNIDVRSGGLQRVINGPEMHRWHHGTEVFGINFATKLAIWDWMFGTAYLPTAKPRVYGVAGSAYPEGYFTQTLHAFRPFAPA